MKGSIRIISLIFLFFIESISSQQEMLTAIFFPSGEIALKEFGLVKILVMLPLFSLDDFKNVNFMNNIVKKIDKIPEDASCLRILWPLSLNTKFTGITDL